MLCTRRVKKAAGERVSARYTASMAAQTITPIVAGYLLKHVSYSVLFLYSAIFVGLAFFTMLMVRHGDVKVEAKRGLEAFDVDD